MQPKKRIVFILNPISGTRKKARVPALIQKYLDKTLWDYEIATTERAFHAHELAKGAAEAGVEVVVAVGGDGTVNEVGSALLQTNSALGILPFGSGNGLARQMKIPMDTARAIKLLNTPAFTTIDAAHANGKVFFCTAGLGFDAHIGRLFSTTSTRGFGSYVKIVLKEFTDFTPHIYTIKTNGQKFQGPFFVVTLANAGQYGNNAYISPNADIADGLIDLCLLKPFPRPLIGQMGWRLFARSMHKSSYIQIIRTKAVQIECPQTECMHLDGEFVPIKGSLTIEMIPQSLRILAPSSK